MASEHAYGRLSRQPSDTSAVLTASDTFAVAFDRISYIAPAEPSVLAGVRDRLARSASAASSTGSASTLALAGTHILHGVSGAVRPGECCAILGSSGLSVR